MSEITCCRGCGLPIRWIKTPAGKYMPVDAEPVAYWLREGASERIVLRNGRVILAATDGPIAQSDGSGYRPHWGSCPKRNKFTGGKK